MAIMLYTIEDGPSLYELMMTLFPEDDSESSLADLERPRLRRFEVGNSPTKPKLKLEAYVHTVRRGYWDSNRKERCFFIQGEIREDDGRHIEDHFAAVYFPKSRFGTFYLGSDDYLEIDDEHGIVHSCENFVGFIDDLKPLTGFFYSASGKL